MSSLKMVVEAVSGGGFAPDETVKVAAGDQQPALAITDFNNLFGAIKFYKEARAAGVKPIVGAEIPYVPRDWPRQRGRLVVNGVVREFEGTHPNGDPACPLSWLASHAQARGRALQAGAPAERASEARCQNVTLLNAFHHVRRTQVPLEHFAARQEPTYSSGCRSSRSGMQLIVSRTGLPATGSWSIARTVR